MVSSNPFVDVRVTSRDAHKFEQLAASWNLLQNSLLSLDEMTLAKLFKWEINNRKRIHILNRIKSRHNRLRDQRERKELFGELYDA